LDWAHETDRSWRSFGVSTGLLTGSSAVVSLSTNDDADTAYRIFHTCGSLLAARGIGVVAVADTLAAFVALPVGVYRSGSWICADTGAPVFPCPIARMEESLTSSYF